MDLAIRALIALGDVVFLLIVIYLGHLIIKYKGPFAWIHATAKEKKTVWVILGVFLINVLLIVTLAMFNNRGLIVE